MEQTKKQSITEEVINLEDVDSVGGIPNLRVEDVKEVFVGNITGAIAKKTQWGNRVDYILVGEDGYEHIISSWIFISRKRFKPSELVGENVRLKPYSEKKLLLEVI